VFSLVITLEHLTYPRPEDILIYEGPYFTAEWYYTKTGELPARTYYAGLGELDRRGFFHLVKLFCDTRPGQFLPKTMYRVEDVANKIYAFKPRDERYFNFTTSGAKVIVTNAYHKHSREMTKQDLNELRFAVKCRADYMNRVTENTYYED